MGAIKIRTLKWIVSGAFMIVILAICIHVFTYHGNKDLINRLKSGETSSNDIISMDISIAKKNAQIIDRYLIVNIVNVFLKSGKRMYMNHAQDRAEWMIKIGMRDGSNYYVKVVLLNDDEMEVLRIWSAEANRNSENDYLEFDVSDKEAVKYFKEVSGVGENYESHK